MSLSLKNLDDKNCLFKIVKKITHRSVRGIHLRKIIIIKKILIKCTLHWLQIKL